MAKKKKNKLLASNDIIENLTNTRWNFKRTIDVSKEIGANIYFEVDYITYSTIWSNIHTNNDALVYTKFDEGEFFIYEPYDASSGWETVNDRTIYISDGTDITNKSFINWLIENAILLDATYVNVTYYSEHGIEPEPIDFYYGHHLTSEDLPTLSEEGWRFKGWNHEEGFEVLEDIIITAIWEEIPSYTITYQSDHGIVPQSKIVKEGYILTSEDLPTLSEEGWRFKGWNYEEGFEVLEDIIITAIWEEKIPGKVYPGDEISNDITIYAHWYEYIKHKITYVTEFRSVDDKYIYENEVITQDFIPVLHKKFYEFQGWWIKKDPILDLSGTKWHLNNVLSVDDFIYKINFISNNIEYSSLESYIDEWGDEKEHYMVYDNISHRGIAPYNRLLSQEYETYWTAGEAYQNVEILSGDDTTNLDLIQWFKDNGTLIEENLNYEEYIKVNIGDKIEKDETFYAKWHKLEGYIITFDSQGKFFPPDSIIVSEGSLIPKPSPDPEVTGYTFLGWSTDRYGITMWDFETSPTSDMILYAIFEIIDEPVEVDWTRSMKQTFEYYLVDPKTFKDSKRLTDIISSSINRDESVDTLGSASFNSTTEMNDDYIRTYLVVEQDNIMHKECLGTHLVQSPENKYNGRRKDISLDGYTSLIELKNEYMPLGYTIRKVNSSQAETGNYLEIVFYMLMEHMRAPVVQPTPDSNAVLYNHFIANADDSYFSFINDVLAYGNYYLDVDVYGTVSIKKSIPLKAIRPSWIYDTNNSSILKADITDKRDLYDIPNIVEVIYSDASRTYFTRVTNNDPNSSISTVKRGRKVVYRETNPSIPENMSDTNAIEYIQSYAKLLLEEKSTLQHTITYSHGYCPVKLGDGVFLNYPKAGINKVKARVISQSIECSTGCIVEETAMYTEPLWTIDMDYEITPEETE